MSAIKEIRVGGTNYDITDKNIATIEETSTASQAYSVGDYLVYQGVLYKVTSAISQGGALTVGSNITSTSVGDELAKIESTVNGLVNDTPVYYQDYSFSSMTLSGGQSNNSSHAFTAPATGYIIGAVTCLPSSTWVQVCLNQNTDFTTNTIGINANNLSSSSVTVTPKVRILWVKATSV